MVLNELRKTLSCVAWRFFREHYSFVGSTTERLAAKTRANERQSPCGFPVLASSPSLPADVLWGSSLPPSFVPPLRGGYPCPRRPGLRPPLFTFPAQPKPPDYAGQKNLCCLKKVQRHHITALGQVTLSLPRLFCVQTHPPHCRFFTEGRGSRGRNYTG